MRILLDLQGCQSEGSRQRGIGRYSMALAQALVRIGTHHEFWLLLNAAFADTVEPLRLAFAHAIPPERVRCFHPPRDAIEARAEGRWQVRAAEEIRRCAIRQVRPDIVHVSSLFEGFGDECTISIDPERDGAPTAVTVYDFIPLLYAERQLPGEAAKSWYMRRLESLQRAALLLGISASACEEARSVLPQRHGEVVNISSAADPLVFHPGPAGDAVQRLGLRPRFVMYTGGTNWRKNLVGLVQAYALLPAALREAHQLALVCHAEDHARTEVLAVAQRAGLAPGSVVFTGYVPDEDLVDLYRSCELFVFPSLHEGFGLPALEAMMCGAAVIGSSASSVPEVIGHEDALFDPSSPASMSALMRRALEDEAFRASLKARAPAQAAMFSWERTATGALRAMEAVHARAAPKAAAVRARERPRLALHSPLPPAKSGIAAYTCELAIALSAHYDIEFVWDDEAALPPALSCRPVRSTEWFREHAAEFDRVVYQIGNSVLHAKMFALLRDHPGTVVLHDFYLGGVFDWMENLGLAPGIFERELFGSHGPAARAYERAHGREAAVRKYPANRFVLERASGVIVHSGFAMNAADEWYGSGSSRDWRRIRHARAVPTSVPRAQARAELGLAADELLVCSFGHLGSPKLNDRLLDAWSRSSLAADRNARLVFVGQNARPPFGDEISRRVRGSNGQFAIIGFVERDAYERYLAAADIAVQLRAHSRGETSGAIVDALAYGVPLIANAHGTAAEYPPDVVCLLADEFSDAALAEALERLAGDPGERRRLGQDGPAWVRAHHDPARIAAEYRDAIEAFAGRPHRIEYWEAVDAIAGQGAPAHRDDLVAAAIALAATAR